MNETQIPDFYDTVDYFISLLDKPKIIQNAVEVDGVIYRSTSVHDYIGLPDQRAIDGGHEYLRRVGRFDENEDLSLYSDSPWEVIYDKLTWGTYGIDGRQPLRWVRIKDMSASHIQNVLNMFEHTNKLSKYTLQTLRYWLNKKKEYQEAVEWLAKNELHVAKLVSEPYSEAAFYGLLTPNEMVRELRILVEELREALYYSTNALDGEK